MSIPVLLTEMPRMQREIVRAVAAQAGDIVCHETDGFDDLEAAIDATCARVVLTGTSALALSHDYEQLLYRHPRLRVLAIRHDGFAALHQLRPYRSLIDDIAPTDLVTAIRDAACVA